MIHLYIKQYWVHYPSFVLQGFLQGLTSMTTNLNQHLGGLQNPAMCFNPRTIEEAYVQEHYMKNIGHDKGHPSGYK
jgi:hypothetical protein